MQLLAERNMLDRYSVTVDVTDELFQDFPSSFASCDLPSMNEAQRSTYQRSVSDAQSTSSSRSASSSDDDHRYHRSRQRRRRRRIVSTIEQPTTASRSRRRSQRRRQSRPFHHRVIQCCLKQAGQKNTPHEFRSASRQRNDVFAKTRSSVSNGEQQRSPERFLMIGRRDVFYRGGLLKARYMIQDKSVSSASCPVLYKARSDQEDYHGVGQRCCEICHGPWRLRWSVLLVKFKSAVDITLFLSFVFNYFCLHSFLLFFTYDIPYVYIPDVAITHNISDQRASFLVSIIGISSTVGQVTMCWTD